jgi:hypothetical protein
MVSDVLCQNGKAGYKSFAHILSSLKSSAPKSRAQLKNFVKVFFGIDIPDVRICSDHAAPMDYLWHCYSCDTNGNLKNGDAVIWANRSGGKTLIAAVITVLDCIFKPGCQCRILAGSSEQAQRMYEYVADFVSGRFAEAVDGQILKNKCRFTNSSAVEIMTQSQRNVRGRHVHKLRCDEVELFDPDVLAASKFITNSTDSIKASMEITSTMHRPYGLMHDVTAKANQSGTAVMKWCMWEVIEKCTDRSCSGCPLWSDCRGRAKNAKGYLKIDDCITQMQRSSRAGFESEMLCKRPTVNNAVFSQFDPQVHVGQVDYDPNLPLYRSIDFGFVNPFYCLWIQTDQQGNVRVIDEYIRRKATIDIHAQAITERTPDGEASVVCTFCDPAGAGRNDITGTSAVKELRRYGIKLRYSKSRILDGIELIRRAIRNGQGKSSLVISPKCQNLIQAMQCYHFRSDASELPDKDGLWDHQIDALRYFFINIRHNTHPTGRRY